MMFLPLFILIGDLFSTQLIELLDPLVLSGEIIQTFYKFLLLGTLLTLPELPDIFYSPIIRLSSIAIDIIPVLSSLLGILTFLFNRI